MQHFPVTTAAGGLGQFELSCNGIFDPDNAGATTHQPMYRDQLAAIYNKYVVLSSTATFTFHLAATSAAPAILVGCCILPFSGAAPGQAVTLAEQPTAIWKVIPGVQATPQDAYQTVNRITIKWDTKKSFGGDVIDNTSLGADIGANPTEQTFFNFFCQDAAATPAAISALVVTAIVTYNVQWFDLNTESAS